MKIGTRKKLLIFSFVILAGIGFIGYSVYESNQKLLDSAQWVEHTEKVIYNSGNILALTKDVEAASRGFVITNDSSFLEPLYTAKKLSIDYINQLRQLTMDNPSQQRRIDSLGFYMAKRLDFSQEVVELRSKEGMAPAAVQTAAGEGKLYTEHIRSFTDAIQQEENALLEQRKITNERRIATFNDVSIVTFILMTVCSILLLITCRNYLFQNEEKESRAAELMIANKKLAFQNEEKEKRASELIIANEELAFQNEEKENRASELIIANKELAFQNKEKEDRASELIVANKELAFQNKEKEDRASELIVANKELVFQNREKEKRAAELVITNTELKEAEEKLIKRNRLYSFISHINQTIVRVTDKETLFDEAVRIAVEMGEFKMAWIGVADKENMKINLVASRGATRDEIIMLSDYEYDVNGPTEKIMQGLEYFAVGDVQKELGNICNPDSGSEHYNSCISLPIKISGVVMGTFNIFSIEKNFFDTEEIKTLVEAANDVSFALDTFEKERQRTQAEEDLEHSETKLKEAQSIAHTGNWELDFADNTLILSDEGCRIFGMPIHENRLSFETWTSLVHPEDIDTVLESIKESQVSLTDTNYEHRIVLKDGTIKHIYSESKFDLDLNGKPVSIFGITQDVTEKKLAEMERTKITSDLIQRNKDLEQFSYIVSHNLRAPLANIMGLSEAARYENLSVTQKKEVMEGLTHSVKRLDEVVIDLNNILNVKQEISQRKEMVSFSKIANDIRSSIENLIEKEKAILIWDFSEVDEMLTLKSYLHSIFYNLISNSIKYHQPGIPPVIEIKSRKFKNQIELLFTDNGMGIDLEKKADQVFGLYKRFHTASAEGKGMGLYMVKTQVESLGGRINIASKINEGTTFEIEFKI